MKTNNEARHEQNVIHLEALITVITTFGTIYNPARQSLTIPGLTELLQKGKLGISTVDTAKVVEKNATAARTQTFEGLDKLTTRVISALRISGISAHALEQAEAIVRDLRGKRASDLLSEEELAAEKAKGNEITQVTEHKGSFDSKIGNFSKLILFLESTPEYTPNETELTVDALKAKLNEMTVKNSDIMSAAALVDAARIARDKVLYDDQTGLVNIALDVKQYVKSLFGASSPEFKQVNAIKFFNR